jgi:hypothetical protein
MSRYDQAGVCEYWMLARMAAMASLLRPAFRFAPCGLRRGFDGLGLLRNGRSFESAAMRMRVCNIALQHELLSLAIWNNV